MNVSSRVLLSAILLFSMCACAQKPAHSSAPQPAAPAAAPNNPSPAKVGEDVPGTNGQMMYAEVQPLSHIEQGAVEDFNTKAAVLQNQMQQLTQSGQELIEELKNEHKVKNENGRWLVSSDGKSLVLVREKKPTTNPETGKPLTPPVKPAPPAPKK